MPRLLFALAPALALAPVTARAADLLTVVETVVDRPTVISLGVQVRISDDDDRDATVGLRYRVAGESSWTEGLPLWRVRPELVSHIEVPQQFAGSAFELRPATTYELELHALDPDGLDETWTVMATTRAVPGDPAAPNEVAVSDADGLHAALAAAAPGDVITLAEGTYPGAYSIEASGTADAPIVIRGASTEGVVLDGMQGEGNILEVYGSHVHIERMTLQGANRAIRFQTAGAEGNVVRRAHIRDVNLGIGARQDQRDFYLCDNLLEGPLSWPQVYGDDGGQYANVDGINVQGEGHVVCHNELVGFGDAIKTEQDGARAVDIYGNLTRSAYDNAIELDGSAGNTRAFRNVMLNSWSPLSFQPIFGGPAYALRNVAVNIVDEQQKLHANSDTGETVGAIVLHNTFVSPGRALDLHTEDTARAFRLQNNLYVGPDAPEGGKSVDWTAPVDDGVVNYNGYYPDGAFDFGAAGEWPDFAAMQSGGVFESEGVLLTGATFASGLAAPADYTENIGAADIALDAASPAVDAGALLPGLGGFLGAGPDLGALELGCEAPPVGPRPEGVDESTPLPACGEEPGETTSDTGGETEGDTTGGDTTSGSDSDSGGAGPTGDLPTTGGGDGGPTSGGDATSADTGGDTGQATGGEDSAGGCACRSATPGPGPWALLLALGLGRRRRVR